MNEAPLLLTREQVCEMMQASPRTLGRAIKAGTMPPPVFITPGQPRWPKSDVEAAIDAARKRAGYRDK